MLIGRQGVAKIVFPTQRKHRASAQQDTDLVIEGGYMRSFVKKQSKKKTARLLGKAGNSRKSGTSAIRKISEKWARYWNASDADGIAALYAEDAVYLPPHHQAVHGRDAICEYLKTPLAHGISDLVFEVAYIKQQGSTAWDIGTYRMRIPQPEGTTREDHGKYLSVWSLRGKAWLLVADAWSSDLPPSA
jgi:uncharacterized protein (TIGR02246 family)